MTSEQKRIKALAAKTYKDARKICHIHPRAYCVAGEYGWRTLAVPPQDNEQQISGRRFVTVHTDLGGGQKSYLPTVGEWCAVVYIATNTFGFNMAIKLDYP